MSGSYHINTIITVVVIFLCNVAVLWFDNFMDGFFLPYKDTQSYETHRLPQWQPWLWWTISCYLSVWLPNAQYKLALRHQDMGLIFTPAMDLRLRWRTLCFSCHTNRRWEERGAWLKDRVCGPSPAISPCRGRPSGSWGDPSTTSVYPEPTGETVCWRWEPAESTH